KRPAVLVDDLDRASGDLAQRRRVGAAEPRLHAAALARAEQELLGNGIGVGVIPVEVLLDVRHQRVELAGVVDVDEELNESPVLPLRRVNEQEAQAAAADE